MIKISKLADYSIHIVHALSLHICESAAKIAEKTGISEPTVSKILKKLTEAKIVISSQGSKGGYQLSRSAQMINLAELISAVDGKPAMTDCCKTDYHCAQAPSCGFQDHWQKINKIVFDVLAKVSLEEMNPHVVAQYPVNFVKHRSHQG